MISFVEGYNLDLKLDGDNIILSGFFKLENNGIHSVTYIIAYQDMYDFIEGDENEIIANDDTVYIYFMRNHAIIEEEMTDAKKQFAIDDSTELFNMIASWWHNH